MSNSAKTRNRRQSPRKRVDASGEVITLPATSKTAPMPVRVRDVSATGVGIVAETPLPIGQKCVVKQESFTRDQPRLYTVVRADPIQEGQYSVGMHASHLLDPHAPAEPSGRAGDNRNPVSLGVLLLLTLLLIVAITKLF